MDVTKKVVDLMKLALNETTPPHEAANAAMGALRLIEEYKLLATEKHVDVAASIINKIIAVTNPIFAEEAASRVEKIVDSVDRAFGAFKKLTDRLTPPERGDVGGRGGGRRRKKRVGR